MLVKIISSTLKGIEAINITIEVNILFGAKFVIVGLPDNTVKESQERIDSALREIGFKIPGKRVIINLSPADIKKEGASFDLPIALGIMSANEDIKASNIDEYLIVGELSLDGSILPIKGILPITINAFEAGFKKIIVPKGNANEAAAVEGIKVYGFTHIADVVKFFNEENHIEATPFIVNNEINISSDITPDFSEVKGQENAKRAMEIAAAGGHNVLLVGSPGSGKTMISKRFPSILPKLNREESLETTKIHSVTGNMRDNAYLITERPFRSPHHTISDIALVGGGNYPQPGEISLAHNGVLFLDELPEFKRSVLEVMRQPLEDRVITISRAKYSITYPANFMMIASMNPCPCGYYNHPTRECSCPPGRVRQYLSKISGPLLDRIDMHIEVFPVETSKLNSQKEGEKSEAIRKRVVKAREIQINRYKSYKGIYCNAQITSKLLKKYCKPTDDGFNLLKKAINKFGLSARAYDRILKLARTIADLDNKENIETIHIAEAIQYRSLDKDSWGI